MPQSPNIVFILCDNVGWGDFAVYGGGTPTPRIDQLASEGAAARRTVCRSAPGPNPRTHLPSTQGIRRQFVFTHAV